MRISASAYDTALELQRVMGERSGSSMSLLGMTVNPTVFPLNLVSFNAAMATKGIMLFWITDNENSASAFEIHRSVDAYHFTPAGVLQAKNGFSTNSYSFVDSAAEPGKVYFYRLKMIDKNGSFTYSGLLTVNNTAGHNISTYPNPTTNSFVLNHPQADAETMVRILSNDGKALLKGKLSEGTTKTGIDVSSLSMGNYYIVYENNKEKQVTKFSKF